MVKVLLKYGWHGSEAMFNLLEDELEIEAWKDYTANILCMIARPHYESTIPLYTELYTELVGNRKPENTMTADEIYNQVMGKLDELAMEGV